MARVYIPDEQAMFAYLRGRLDGSGFEQSRAALVFVRRIYAGQDRAGDTSSIIHPLSMACDAIACKGVTDEIIATMLLHDVCTNWNIPVSALPVNDIVKRAINLMMICPSRCKDTIETKQLCYRELLNSKEAVICKAFDSYANLNDMVDTLNEEIAIKKDIRETHALLMPILKEAKYIYPELSDMLHIIRIALKRTLIMMAAYHKVNLKN